MCIQDVAIGVSSPSQVVNVTAGVAASNAIGANNKRRSLFFAPPLAGTITYLPSGRDLTSGAGINVAAGSSGIQLLVDVHGLVVREGWDAIGDAAGRVASIIESTLDKEWSDAARKRD